MDKLWHTFWAVVVLGVLSVVGCGPMEEWEEGELNIESHTSALKPKRMPAPGAVTIHGMIGRAEDTDHDTSTVELYDFVDYYRIVVEAGTRTSSGRFSTWERGIIGLSGSIRDARPIPFLLADSRFSGIGSPGNGACEPLIHQIR